MTNDYIFGTVLIRENTLLPVGLAIETAVVFPGWRTVRDLDGYKLARALQKTNWNFFCLAGEMHAIALGRKWPASTRRAVRRILKKLQGQQFNCLEITEIMEKRFLGLPFVSVSANSRHIQESAYLVPLVGPVLGTPAAAAATPATKLDINEGLLHPSQGFTKQDAAVI
ncbi:MAG: hypothetical protein WBR26_18110 [Candidatus Acidiferrum sp.]